MKTSTALCEEQGSTKYILGSWAYCSLERVRPCEGTVGASLPEGPTGSLVGRLGGSLSPWGSFGAQQPLCLDGEVKLCPQHVGLRSPSRQAPLGVSATSMGRRGVLGSWQGKKVLKAVNTLEMNCVQRKDNKMVHFRRT